MFKMLRKSGINTGVAGKVAQQKKAPVRAAVQPGRIVMPADGKPTAKTAAKPALSLTRIQKTAKSPLQRTTAARQAVNAAPKPAPKKVPLRSASAAQKRSIASMLGRRRGF